MAAVTSKKLGLGALLLGVLLMLLGVLELVIDWQFFRSAVSAEGTVWYTSTNADNGGRGVRVRVPVAEGEVEIWMLPYHVAKTANATVTVAWPAGRPEEARINSPAERIVVPLLFFAFGLPLLWVSRWLQDESLPDWAQEAGSTSYHRAEEIQVHQQDQKMAAGRLRSSKRRWSKERVTTSRFSTPNNTHRDAANNKTDNGEGSGGGKAGP